MSVRLMVKAMHLFEDEPNKDTNIKKTASQPRKGKLKRLTQSNSAGSIVRSKKIKSVVDEYRKKQMGDMTEDNLYILQQLSSLKPKTEAAHKVILAIVTELSGWRQHSRKILEHHTKRLNKNTPIPSEPEDCEPKSILFPEEDKHKKKKKH